MTSNIDRRLDQRNQHLSNVRYTKKPTDFELIFCAWFPTRDEARMIEKYLKGGSGRDFRQNLLQ